MDSGPPGETLLREGFPASTTPSSPQIEGGTNSTLRLDTVNLKVTPPAALPSADLRNFRRIGHCLSAMLFGLLGAFLGRMVAIRAESGADPSPTGPDAAPTPARSAPSGPSHPPTGNASLGNLGS